MSGRKIALLVVICAMLVTISCSTTGFVWDDTIPPDQSAKIWFMYFVPKTYNGIDFDIGKNYFTTFPAGDAEFWGDISWSNTVNSGTGFRITSSYNEKDVVFSCNLEGGKEYSAVVSREYVEEINGVVWGIGLYKEIKTFIGNKPPKERLIVFIPFHSPE